MLSGPVCIIQYVPCSGATGSPKSLSALRPEGKGILRKDPDNQIPGNPLNKRILRHYLEFSCISVLDLLSYPLPNPRRVKSYHKI